MNEKKELTRSELVRLRREQEHAKRMQRAAKEAIRSVPITTRARQDAIQPRRRTTRSMRRRFHIALHLPRADMRSINLPRPRFGWRFLSFVLAAILGAAIYLAFNHPAFRVGEAQVSGNQILSPADVNSVMAVAGQPIFLIKPAELETRLRLNYPELVSVTVSVSLPNLVTVHVTERQPIIRWEQGGGYTWIAEDGVAFKPRGELSGLIPVLALTAPPVEGAVASDPMNPAPFISTEMVQSLKGLAGHAPAGVPILYESGMGFGWDDPRGWRVYFGTKANDVELKVRVYEAMVNSLTQRGIRPALINVTYPTAPYYRMSQ
ncbi:MAG: FtsQ-type POTRA domain-containing protein [Chloroflexi bacterium]|nr:FtsQ-type POTRA domain-containing protein [Chloroflexota bacterium]